MIRLPPRSPRTDTLFPLHDALPISASELAVVGLFHDAFEIPAFYMDQGFVVAGLEINIGSLAQAFIEADLDAVKLSDRRQGAHVAIGEIIPDLDRKSTRLNSSH